MRNHPGCTAKSIASRAVQWAALGASALMAGGGGAQASEPGNAGTTFISLDGQCDVIQITVFPWHQAGEFASGCGVGTGVGSGMEGNVTGVLPKDLTIAETWITDPDSIYLWNIQYPLSTGNTWSIYQSFDGANFFFYNGGTYTIIDAAQARLPHAGPSAHSAATGTTSAPAAAR